jgi:hypothetical protein
LRASVGSAEVAGKQLHRSVPFCTFDRVRSQIGKGDDQLMADLLPEAGCTAIYGDPSDLLPQYDRSPLARR